MKKISGKRWFAVLICAVLLGMTATQFLPVDIIGREAREHALRGECRNHLLQLSELCRRYAADHDGVFPADGIQEKNIVERLRDERYLSDANADMMTCPSTKPRLLKSSYHFIPGIRTGMSPKMPCVIERITNHDRLIGVVYVDGTVAQLDHEFQDYTSLLEFFPDITPAEKTLLRIHFQRLDIP